MSKEDGYERPDAQEIRKRRKIAKLSPEQLAEKADVAVSTIKRAERGLRVQLRNLSKIASALGVRPEIIAPELSRYQGLQVLERWGMEFDLIAEANKSILIIDSFFSEYGRLASALRARSKTHQEEVTIDIYMASPDRIFGAQRLREMTALPILKSEEGNSESGECAEALLPELRPFAIVNYESYFNNLQSGIKGAAGQYASKISIHEYFCMPSLRVVAIDSVSYVWGWYPIFRMNPAHTAFFLRDENLEGANLDLLNDIRTQIDGVKEASIAAKSGNQRHRGDNKDNIRTASR